MSEKRRLVYLYKLNNPCVDCGEVDPCVLQFDHVKGRKVGNISDMVKTASIEDLQKEMRKCEIRCANCHMRRTARVHGWYQSYS